MKCRFCNCLLTGTEENEGVCYDCSTLTCDICGDVIELGIDEPDNFLINDKYYCDDCYGDMMEVEE